MATEVFAPAKINLTLHVTGQRDDGYHLLDSLVVFAGIGDTVSVASSDRLSLTINGPEAAGLDCDPDNLVLRAARLMQQNGQITLTKRLPVASGIGGGSADAAATLRAMAQHHDCFLPDPQSVLQLGADVPVCLASKTTRMSGVGDILASVPRLPAMDIVLVNPRVSVSTPQVFRSLRQKANSAMPATLPNWSDLTDFAAWLQQQRNDLLAPAIAQAPVIGDVLEDLKAANSLHVGMSGSGATCFGLFTPDGSAAQAVSKIRPDWWRAHGPVL